MPVSIAVLVDVMPTLARSLGAQIWDLACEAWWDLWCDAWGEIGAQVDARGDWNELREACGVRQPDARTAGALVSAGGGVWEEIDRKVGGSA